MPRAHDAHPPGLKVEFIRLVQAGHGMPAHHDIELQALELLRRSLKGGAATAAPTAPPKKAATTRKQASKTAANDEHERAAAAGKPSGKARTSVTATKRKAA